MEGLSHIGPCAKLGARQASLDPGVMNFCDSGEDGLPGKSRGQFGNSLDDIETTLEVMAKEKVGPALGIYEPGYLRPVLAFRKADAVILGVSVDDVESHKKFSEEHKLPFDILADSEKKVSDMYGVLFSAGPMKLASRQTFLIDPSGRIVKHWPKVDPKGHSDMVLAEIKAHSPAKTG